MPRPSPQTERMVQVLQFLAADTTRQRSLAEIARMLQVEKSTCYPMLAELHRVGWLVRHSQKKTYQLGPGLVPIGEAAKGATDVVSMAQPVLAKLADELDVTCSAVVTSGSGLLVADLVHPRHGRRDALSTTIGNRLDHRPPVAATFAAWAGPEEQEAWVAADPRSRDESVAEHYRAVCAAVRRRGYAVEHYATDEPVTRREVERALSRADGVPSMRLVDAQRAGLLVPEMAAAELVPGASYWPYAISAPAFDGEGRAVVAICALDFGTAMTSAEIASTGLTVRAAARQLTAAMHGSEPDPRHLDVVP